MKLPKFELLLLSLVLLTFAIWAIAKCNQQRGLAADTPEPEHTVTASSPEDPDSLPPMIADSTTFRSSGTAPSGSPAAPPGGRTVVERSVLYVTIDGLKLRAEPGLDAKVIGKLPLFEKVYFMDEVTDFTQKINLGLEEADEPWVKIRTKKGRVGWVYGAGVNFYKKKRGGVL